VSPTKTVAHPPRGPTALHRNGSRPGVSSYRGRAETIDREHLLESLTHLRSIVPVFAMELVSARRQAARLRVENGRLLEQVRHLRGCAQGDRSAIYF
jgi:hypothetical protein